MSGSPIQLAVGALKLFLHSLPLGSKFNVVSFGTDFKKLFPDSVEYNEDNLKIAVSQISKFNANMGGTELLNPLKDIVSVKGGKDLPRCLYLLTDGAVFNTEEVVNLIRANNQNCSVNTFGIGSGADENLIKNSAKAGKGHFTFIHQLHEIETKVIEALTKDFYEYLTVKDIRVFDDKSKVYRDLSHKTMDLSHGENVEIVETFEQSPFMRFNRLEIVVHDPNTKQDAKQMVDLIDWNHQDQAISMIAASRKIQET